MKKIKLTVMIILLFVFVASHAQARQILPDGLGYSAIDSNEADGPVFDYIDISATGTREDLGDDGNAADVPIGFTFNYYGMDYTTLGIGSNGFLFFGPSTGDGYNDDDLPIPQIGDANGWQDPPFIAPWFDDLNPEGTAGDPPISKNYPIFRETLGTAPDRQFIVQYQVPHFDNDNEPFDFEVILFEGSHKILFQYKVATTTDPNTSNGISATVGLQGKDDVGFNLSVGHKYCGKHRPDCRY